MTQLIIDIAKNKTAFTDFTNWYKTIKTDLNINQFLKLDDACLQLGILLKYLTLKHKITVIADEFRYLVDYTAINKDIQEVNYGSLIGNYNRAIKIAFEHIENPF